MCSKCKIFFKEIRKRLLLKIYKNRKANELFFHLVKQQKRYDSLNSKDKQCSATFYIFILIR